MVSFSFSILDVNLPPNIKPTQRGIACVIQNPVISMISAAAAVILLFAASVNESARAVNVTITDFQTPWVTGTQYGAGVKTQGLGHCTHDSLQFEKKQTGESYEEQDCSVLTWIDVTGCYHVRVGTTSS